MGWVAYYKQYEAIILFIAAWLLSIPTGILIARLDRRLEKRSKEREISSIFNRYERVVNRRVEIQRGLEQELSMSAALGIVLVSDSFKIMLVVVAMALIQMFSNHIVTAVYGKTVANIYFGIVVFLSFILATGLMIAETKDDNIRRDALHLNEYRKKIVTRLVELNCDSNVLNRLDKIEIMYGLRIKKPSIQGTFSSLN